MTDPALFYSGIVAELYGPLRSAVPEAEPYRRFVERHGEPALELGCGTGDPLLELVAGGLKVEGLDSSPDMLAKCRDAAVARGLNVTLHEARMQTMDLGRTYESIYLAGPTFNLILDDATALAALERIRDHLSPTGRALIPLFVPSPTPDAVMGRRRAHVDEQGRRMYVSAVAETFDKDARTQTTVLRYELDGIVEDHPWSIHWHSQNSFASLVRQARLDITSMRGDDTAYSVIVSREAIEGRRY